MSCNELSCEHLVQTLIRTHGQRIQKIWSGERCRRGGNEGFNSIELLHLRDGSYTYFLETCDLYLLVGFENGQ